MEDLWQQFHRLPKVIRDAVASPSALAAVDQLEHQYRDLDLATFVMRVMVKEIQIGQATDELQKSGSLTAEQAGTVWQTLQKQVFIGVEEYLGITAKPVESPKPAAAAPPNLPIAPPAILAPKVSMSAPPPIPTPAPVIPTPPLAPIPTGPKAVPVPSAPPPVAPMSQIPVMTRPVPLGQPSAPAGSMAPTQAYSADDAQEIEQQSQKIQDMAGARAQDLDAMAAAVLAENSLSFSEDVLTKRAISILKAKLKKIRNAEDTVVMLTRPPKVGGLGLDQELARRVIESLDRQHPIIQPIAPLAPAINRIATPLPPPPTAPVPQPSLAQLPPTPVSPPTNPPMSNPLPTPVMETPSVQIPVVEEPRPSPSATAYQPGESSTMMQRARTIDRPSMADIVSPTPQTYGPAEEMRSLTLTDWRRLGQGAADASTKLLEKFDHLKKDSFQLWAEAVEGWRQSQVYLMYLDMGQQSLERGVPITQVVDERARSGQPYLSAHEFSIISDINRLLRP